jgi:hypothetical protein
MLTICPHFGLRLRKEQRQATPNKGPIFGKMAKLAKLAKLAILAKLAVSTQLGLSTIEFQLVCP